MVNPDSIPRYPQERIRYKADPTCSQCAYYRELAVMNRGKGPRADLVGICVYEIFQADTFQELETADPITADPLSECCADFRRAEGC